MMFSLFTSEELNNSSPHDLVSMMKPGRLGPVKLPLNMVKKWSEMKKTINVVFEKLTSPRIKNRTDICVWKICSRPLKFQTKVPRKFIKMATNSKRLRLGIFNI